MNRTKIFRSGCTITCLLVSTSLSLATISEAGTVLDKQTNQKFELKAAKAETNKQSVQKTTDKRKEIVSEAVSALRETQDALKALDEGKSKEAVAGLERATGKLEIVLARDPKVALVPMDVKVVTTKVDGSLDEIRKARQEAESLLRNGQLQEARAILMTLASETIISTINLPMATYPDALKKAAKLIDQNKLNEAKEVLQTALDTLVISNTVIPLPVVEAKVSLQKADELAKMKNRTAEQNKQLSSYVSAADNDIQFAEALGYGSKSDFQSFHKQIAEIRQKTANGKSGIGFFDQIKNYLEAMNKSSQPKAMAQK